MARTSNRPRQNSPLNIPGAFELFKPSKQLVLKHIWIFGPIYALPLIFGLHSWLWSPAPGSHASHWWDQTRSISVSWPGSPFTAYDTAILVGFSALWLIFVLIAGAVASVMAQAAQLDAVENKHLDFLDLWQTVKELGPRLLVLYIITLLAVVIGLALFIIPGLFILNRLYLAPYVMIDKKVGIMEAINQSARLAKLNPGSIWGILGVMLLIGLVGVVPVIGSLASFALGALFSMAPAFRYKQLKAIADYKP